MARLGRAPYHHLENLLLLEEATSFNTSHQRGCLPAHIAWFESIALGLGKVDLDVHLWLLDLQLRMHINGTVNLRERVPHLLGLTAQDAQVGAGDTHDDIVARSRQHLASRLFQVSLHIAPDAGIAFGNLAHPRNGSQLAAGHRRDASHFQIRRARWSLPLNHDVWFLERREHWRPS